MNYGDVLTAAVATTTNSLWGVATNALPSLYIALISFGAISFIALSIVGIFYSRRVRSAEPWRDFYPKM